MKIDREENERQFIWKYKLDLTGETTVLTWKRGSWIANARQYGPRGGYKGMTDLPLSILVELVESYFSAAPDNKSLDLTRAGCTCTADL